MAGYPDLETLLCHCDQTEFLPQDGHPLGTPGCSSQIKQVTRTNALCQRDHYGIASCPNCHSPARGTCPECGKNARVVRIEMRDQATGRVLYGAATPGMAPHRVGGQECPGTGRVPAETTFTPGHARREYLASQVEVA
jgi:hypothetical protein